MAFKSSAVRELRSVNLTWSYKPFQSDYFTMYSKNCQVHEELLNKVH